MRRACLFALLALAGCGGGYASVHADSMWAKETREDWVLHGHELTLMRVQTGTGPQTPRDFKDSGGIIGRRVTVGLGPPLWRRPGAATPPRRFGFDTWGWMMESDQFSFSPRRRMVAEGDTWLEVGREYLALISRYDGEWFPLVAMTLDRDGRITSEAPRGRPPAAAVALRGKTPEQAAELLAATTFPVATTLRSGGSTLVFRTGSRREARQVADGVRALGLRIGEVRSSPHPGARAFARLAFGTFRADEDLAPATAEEARRVAALGPLLRPPRDRTVRVLITHAPNIAAELGDGTATGEALVYADDGIVARAMPADWAALTAGSRSP